jgi:hypothetical protein
MEHPDHYTTRIQTKVVLNLLPNFIVYHHAVPRQRCINHLFVPLHGVMMVYCMNQVRILLGSAVFPVQRGDPFAIQVEV